jgi:hypothetical protein
MGSDQETIQDLPEPIQHGVSIGRDPGNDIVLYAGEIPEDCLELWPAAGALLVMQVRLLFF